MRKASIKRKTKETDISLEIDLDSNSSYSIDTGIAFFNHMLELFAKHSTFGLNIKASGDIEIDYHHTVEDIGIVLGKAVKEALADKLGINRYGFFILPMDECLAQVAIDLSNRPAFVYNVDLSVDCRVRDFNISLIKEFFQAFSSECGANLHIKLDYGQEPHHICECIFKCFARALDMAVRIDPKRANDLPSTKGKL